LPAGTGMERLPWLVLGDFEVNLRQEDEHRAPIQPVRPVAPGPRVAVETQEVDWKGMKYKGRLGDGLIYRMGQCLVILSGPKEREQIGWHFSISCADRNPTWEEQKAVRYALVPDDIYMVSIMPPKREYVAVHEFCFHWYESGPKFFDVKTGRPLS